MLPAVSAAGTGRKTVSPAGDRPPPGEGLCLQRAARGAGSCFRLRPGEQAEKRRPEAFICFGASFHWKVRAVLRRSTRRLCRQRYNAFASSGKRREKRPAYRKRKTNGRKGSAVCTAGGGSSGQREHKTRPMLPLEMPAGKRGSRKPCAGVFAAGRPAAGRKSADYFTTAPKLALVTMRAYRLSQPVLIFGSGCT